MIMRLRSIFDGVLASLTLCTRLPWWRLRELPKEAYERVTDYWPFVGWVTGGVMAAAFSLALWMGFSPALAALMAIAVRLLLTGALHEDGLADFCDGFGGGTTRERTLAIMKDSHIGTYGVIGLILYIGLLWASLTNMADTRLEQQLIPLLAASHADIDYSVLMNWEGAAVILFFDVLGKVAASFVTSQLPYARSEENAKVGVVYRQRSWRGLLAHVVRCTIALALPVVLCVFAGMPAIGLGFVYIPLVLCLLPIPFIVEMLMAAWMRRRIGGYTGDCCGALFLLCELSLYLFLPLLMRYV